MAEVEYGGIKVGGSKLLLIIPLIGTLGGGLWAGFEFYKDYTDMKEQIQSYTAPDLSLIEQELAVQSETVAGYDKRLISARSLTDIQFATIKESRDRISGDLHMLMNDSRDTQRRLYELETSTQKELLDIRKSISIQIEEALANPLAGK